MSARLLSIIIIILALSLADAGVLQRANRDTPCSKENLDAILQSCQESVIPASTETSIASQFCGSSCRDRVADYASSCGHTSFSVNITGTCLVNNELPQCIFAVILIRPGILSCKASAITTNNEPSTFVIDPNIPPVCSLYSAYNSTGEYFQIEFDYLLNQPVIRPPLLPPWSNCSAYYDNLGPVVSTNEPVQEEIVCTQNQLDQIVQDCEEAVKTSTDNNISNKFCGKSCGSRVSAYAAVCNISHFSLNITGTCQVPFLTDNQCIFAIVLIRPEISACSATLNLRDDLDSMVAQQTDLLQEPCCVLHSTVNTTGEFYEIHPDPLTGTPYIQPPLIPPWESCSAYTEHTCNAAPPTVATTMLPSTTPKATTLSTTPKPVSITTTELPTIIANSALSVHHSCHAIFYILTIIIHFLITFF